MARVQQTTLVYLRSDSVYRSLISFPYATKKPLNSSRPDMAYPDMILPSHLLQTLYMGRDVGDLIWGPGIWGLKLSRTSRSLLHLRAENKIKTVIT